MMPVTDRHEALAGLWNRLSIIALALIFTKALNVPASVANAIC
jgi:hypothetical protein